MCRLAPSYTSQALRQTIRSRQDALKVRERNSMKPCTRSEVLLIFCGLKASWSPCISSRPFRTRRLHFMVFCRVFVAIVRCYLVFAVEVGPRQTNFRLRSSGRATDSSTSPSRVADRRAGSVPHGRLQDVLYEGTLLAPVPLFTSSLDECARCRLKRKPHPCRP
jgi:hypothetical protein